MKKIIAFLTFASSIAYGQNLKVFAVDEGWAEGLCVIKPTGWSGVRFTRNNPSSGNFEGNWAIGYNGTLTGTQQNDFSISTYYNGAQYDGIFHISNANRNIGIGTMSPGYLTRLNVVGGAVEISGYAHQADASLHISTSFGQFDRLTQINPSLPSKHALNLMASTDASTAYNWWSWGVLSVGTWAFQPSTSFGGNSGLFIDRSGRVGMGNPSPGARLDVLSPDVLPTTSGSNILLKRVGGNGNGNYFMNNTWIRRYASSVNGVSGDWLSMCLHDGISIDVSYLTPGTDTRTWWERAPFEDIQSWGTSGQAYMTIKVGNVGIGTTTPDAKLAVAGQIHATEVRVTTNVPGPDYVFEKSYSLPTLEQVKSYIDQNKHLPEVPSAAEMEKNGVQLGEMNMLLLKKVEELTLHMIEVNRRVEKLEKENIELKNKK